MRTMEEIAKDMQTATGARLSELAEELIALIDERYQFDNR